MNRSWDSLYIYYISGTGNAKASSEWIADEFAKKGFRVRVQRIDRSENIEFPRPEEKPLIGFAFPTHGFNAAPIMLRFVSSIPKGLGNEVLLVNTRAGMKLSKIFLPGISGMALMMPAFILRLKGYKCIGFRPVDLPSNWIPLHPGLKQKVIESIFRRCERIVRSFAVKIIEGGNVYRGLFSAPFDLLISPISLGYYIGGRFFLSKTFIANNKCNNCGLCIRECPTSSIRLVSGRPFWKITCESCMRCLNRCPEKAIESAHGMAVLFWIVFSSASTSLFYTIISITGTNAGSWWMIILKQIIPIFLMIITAAVLYRIIHYLMSWKPVSYLIRFTSLTTLPFWRRYRHTKNK